MRRALIAAVVAASTLAAPATASAAQGLVGVTATNQVVQFASDSPGNIQRSLPIRGLQAGERIVGLDVRIATGQLYALGTSRRLYTLDASSGLARSIDTGGTFALGLRGSTFGFDFNPTVDRIRVVSNQRQNLRANPNTGTVEGDGDLAYAAGDPGAGTAPAVSAAGYTNSVRGADRTTLFGIDTARDALVRIDPPNDGVLNTVGPLGIEVSSQASFDIVPGSNDAYAVLDATSGVNPTDGPGPRLYRINLATGDATPTQARGRNEVGTFRGRRRVTDNLVALAAVGEVPDDGERPGVVADARQRFSRDRALAVRVSTSEAASITVRLVIRGRTYARRAGEVLGSAGSVVIRPRLGRNGRRLVARRGVSDVRLVVGARDASGRLARATTRTLEVR